MPKRTDIHKVLIIGSGPIIIGQACEFDYSGTQACKALRKLGYEIVLVNSNPATIMTDPETADVTYIEPLNVDRLEQIIAKERPDALLPNLGGQSGLNLCSELNKAGILEKYNVKVIGVQVDAIERGEDRIEFKKTMNKLGIEMARSEVAYSVEEALAIAEKLGLQAEVEDMAFDSIIPAVTSGKADVGLAGMTASEDRKVSVDFSDTYVEAGQVIIVKKGSDIKDASGLTGKTVGVQLGTTGDLYVSDPKNVENVTVQQFPKGADAVEALKTDKIDAVVIDNQPAKKFVENNSDIEILATPLTQESYAIAVAKDNKQLLDAVNKALAELKESGELDSILNKYLANDESAETTTSAQ